MSLVTPKHADSLREQIMRLRGDAENPPNASIIVPVNAQGDLENVLRLLADLTGYRGKHTFEVILVVNNYPPEAPPSQIDSYAGIGLKVVSIPNVRRPGEAVGFSARIPGIRAASSETNILFDADCQIPNPTAVIDWYIKQFELGSQAAYTHVDYYDFLNSWSVRAQIFMHHTSRWVKRTFLRIPTTRGSSYAVNRSSMLQLYERGMLADEMNVGPTFKSHVGRVAYSGSSDLIVLTSGRMFKGGWVKLVKYFRYRLRYNLRVLPVRAGVAQHTKRENDPVRKYINNKPLD
jgi:glycosyltransferase involved in cell wall biosynthesis